MATKRGAEAPCPGGVDTGTEANTTRRGRPRCPLAAAEVKSWLLSPVGLFVSLPILSTSRSIDTHLPMYENKTPNYDVLMNLALVFGGSRHGAVRPDDIPPA